MMATTHPDVLHIMLGSRVEKQHDDQNSTRVASSNRIVYSAVGNAISRVYFYYHNKEGQCMPMTHPVVLHIKLGSRVEKPHHDQSSNRQDNSNRIVLLYCWKKKAISRVYL
jgi:hypothetical protein